jgi:general secretion pathway protein H
MELLLVLALLALLAAVAIPLVNRQNEETTLRATAHQFASLMRTARGAAIRDNTERTLIVDPAGRRFWVAGVTKAYPIGGGIDVRVAAPQGLKFFADASATGGSVVLTAGGHAAVVELDALTGHARVRWRR